MKYINYHILKNESGATLVYVGVVLALLIMFGALGLDVNHLYGVRNEVHNAADSGALAGARSLFSSTGALTRTAAINEATHLTSSNKSGHDSITKMTVETGHWSFATRTFTAMPNESQMDWQEVPFAELDINNNFINAVRVKADRDDTPSFLARILGYDKFFVSADAVAYIGFAGTLHPTELDQPIAICEEAITDQDTDAYSCNQGRMLNSGGNADTSMTAMWTNFTQDPCETANNSDMQDLTNTCESNNPTSVTFGTGIGSQNGVQDNILGNVVDCWVANADTDGNGIPDVLWPLMLPVIQCGVDNNCSPLVGAVGVDVVWIHYKNDPWTQMDHVPTKMEDWTCTTTATVEDRQNCWKSFVDHFNLQNVSGDPMDQDDPLTDAEYQELYQKKNLFFLPSCDDHTPTGVTGGQNFGVLAKIPKLVE